MPHVNDILVNDHIATLRREAELEALARAARQAAPHRDGMLVRLVRRLGEAARRSHPGTLPRAATTGRAERTRSGARFDQASGPVAAQGLD
jgi:hypothetical protein